MVALSKMPEFSTETPAFVVGKKIKIVNMHECAIDRTLVLTKILPNGECGCRGEDGNQSRLNVSANLERPVLNRPFGFWPQKGKKHEK